MPDRIERNADQVLVATDTPTVAVLAAVDRDADPVGVQDDLSAAVAAVRRACVPALDRTRVLVDALDAAAPAAEREPTSEGAADARDTKYGHLIADGGEQLIWVSSGHKNVVHTNPNCPKLGTSREAYRKPRSEYPDLPVCGHCSGGPDGGLQGTKPANKLADMEPEDLGLSPRRDDPELVTDGGEDLDDRSADLLAFRATLQPGRGDDEELVTDGGRTYRDVAGLMGPMDVDRPAWAEGIAVGDVLAYETPAGVLEGRVLGFSIYGDFRGLPAVEKPPELADVLDGDLLVLREDDVVDGGASA